MRKLQACAVLVGGCAMLLAAVTPRAQDSSKRGNPEEHLPSHITQLTAFGERASWSPDGKRIAFMAKSFGDAFVVDVATKTIRLLTPAPSSGLPARAVPADRRLLPDRRAHLHRHPHHARPRPGDVAAARRGGPPIALGHKISEGVAISRKTNRIAWSNTHGQYPDLIPEGESVLYMADIVEDGGRPKLANKVELLRAKRPECTLEAQDFRFDDTELIYTCYRSPYADVFGLDLKTEGDHDLPQDRRRVQRGRRHLPGRQAHAGRVEPRAERAELEPHRHLEDAAGAERHRVRAGDALGRVRGLQGVEPGGQPGRQDDRLPVGAQQGRGRRRLRHLPAEGAADGRT